VIAVAASPPSPAAARVVLRSSQYGGAFREVWRRGGAFSRNFKRGFTR